MMMFDPERAYSSREIAEKLGVTTRTLQRWRQQKKLDVPVALSDRIKRTPGHALNAWWQSFVTPDVTPRVPTFEKAPINKGL